MKYFQSVSPWNIFWPEIDPALPDAAEGEADGEEASLVQQRHRGDGAQLHLQSVKNISLENK